MNTRNLKLHEYVYFKKKLRDKQLEFKLILESNLRNSLNKLEEFLDSIMKYVRIDQRKFTNIIVTLSEALTNAIIHGNKFQRSKLVYLEANLYPDSLSFSLVDEGSGFDLIAVKDPLKEENLFTLHGHGILIMKYLSDSLSYSEEGRKINISFLLR